MVCSSIDYRNDVKMIKTQKKWFHCKVLYILTSFLWSIRAQTMENCCRFVFFYNNIDRFSHPFPLRFLRKSRAQVREKQIAPPSRHIVTSFPWSVLLSREKSLNYCTIYIYIYISLQNCDSLYFPSRFKSSNLRHLKDCFIEQYSPLTPHVLRIQQPPPCNQPKVTL